MSYSKFMLTSEEEQNLQTNDKALFFDEFAVYNRPSIFYGWAQKNTRPEIPSNEKGRRNKLNGMISVDAFTGKEYLKLKEKSKTEDVSEYFLQLCQDCIKEGFNKLTVILDNNSTHKNQMKSQVATHLNHLNIHDKISINFIHTPTYSPNFNLVEYIIHLLRLQLLHHLSLNITIQEVQDKLETFFKFNQLQTPEQIHADN
ncbi:MAG: transposase [Cyanobacteria bacterium P01_D01_bin.50]